MVCMIICYCRYLDGSDSYRQVSGHRVMQANEWLVGSQYKPAELGKNDWSTIRKSPPWAIDSWGLGALYVVPCVNNSVFVGYTLCLDPQLILFFRKFEGLHCWK